MSRSVLPRDGSRKRSIGFLMRMALGFAILASLVIGIYYVSKETGAFEGQLAKVDDSFEALDAALLSRLTAGISVGALLILVAVFVLPVFLKKIDSKEYVKNLVLGLVSAFVFYLSQSLFDYLGTKGKVYVALSVAVVAFIAFFIVELLALIFKSKRKGVEFRTTVMAGIASGLAFGIVLQLAAVAIRAVNSSIRP